MNIMVRPKNNHWAVYEIIDQYHAETLFEGTKEECEQYADEKGQEYWERKTHF